VLYSAKHAALLSLQFSIDPLFKGVACHPISALQRNARTGFPIKISSGSHFQKLIKRHGSRLVYLFLESLSVFIVCVKISSTGAICKDQYLSRETTRRWMKRPVRCICNTCKEAERITKSAAKPIDERKCIIMKFCRASVFPYVSTVSKCSSRDVFLFGDRLCIR